MALVSLLRRRIKIFLVALTVFLDYKAVQKREKWRKKEENEALWEQAHKRNAKRVLDIIYELKGLWVKAGQYLSTRADVLPNAYIESLRELQDSLPPRPISEVYYIIENELGRKPKELFIEFDDIPIATASIAQVHHARTKDGMEVVVKVQHKGIKECILQDLQNARKIVEWIAWAEPDYDFSPVVDAWCTEIPKELNFNIEADNTRKVSQNLCSWRKQTNVSALHQVDVLVPDVLQSSEKVLVLEYMDGIRISDLASLDKLGVDKQALIETITRAYAHQIYVDGFFNADPHPGNFLVKREAPFHPVLLDFGLTKSLGASMKQAFAKMLLSCAEGDYAALLSAFSEMGVQLHIDMPEEAMKLIGMFFRRSMPAKESRENFKSIVKEKNEQVKRIKDKMQEENEGKDFYRKPIDGFPSDAVFFVRVLELLRGISAMLDTEVAYIEVMRPYAEAALWSDNVLDKVGHTLNSCWIWNTPVQSELEEKLRHLLLKMGREQRILGIQVCVYKDGHVVIDTAAGVLGKLDPRPVQPDSLFPVFSVTKGVTAGLVHWLADRGKLSLTDKVGDLWPEFAVNGKDNCTVAHVLNHTAGLHNGLLDVFKEDPLLMCKWNDMLAYMETATPESMPGIKQEYHAFSFGWLCGGIIEKATGRSFQQVLEEAFVQPLGVSGEFYIGIPPGVESRLASLTLDVEDLALPVQNDAPEEPLSATQVNGSASAILSNIMSPGDALELIKTLPILFSTLFVRRAVIPAANGHFSARALALYYLMLGRGGSIPITKIPSEPPLGSHPHFPQKSKVTGRKKSTSWNCVGMKAHRDKVDEPVTEKRGRTQIFRSTDIHDSFLGFGKHKEQVQASGRFGLGFQRLESINTEKKATIPFGHSGVGGSTAFCDPENDIAVAITVNKMSRGRVTAEIVQLVYSELGLPCPSQYSKIGGILP